MTIERVVFAQEGDATEPLRIYDDSGYKAAIVYLAEWHYPGEHETADEPAAGSDDDTFEEWGYILAVNTRLGYIGLEAKDGAGIPWEERDEILQQTADERHESDRQESRDKIADLDEFTVGYLECALWAETQWWKSMDCPPAIDEDFEMEDLSVEAIERAAEDCADFQAANENDLRAYPGGPEHAGHDFWLTRNGHGAGFWDRGTEARFDRLSKAAKAYGSQNIDCDGRRLLMA